MRALFSRLIKFTFIAVVFLALPACSTPSTPSLVGINKFHDITQVRRGMSANEVERVMGANHKNEMVEGIRGMDGGNYTWVYSEGRVNFGMNGVTSIEPN